MVSLSHLEKLSNSARFARFCSIGLAFLRLWLCPNQISHPLGTPNWWKLHNHDSHAGSNSVLLVAFRFRYWDRDLFENFMTLVSKVFYEVRDLSICTVWEWKRCFDDIWPPLLPRLRSPGMCWWRMGTSKFHPQGRLMFQRSSGLTLQDIWYTWYMYFLHPFGFWA